MAFCQKNLAQRYAKVRQKNLLVELHLTYLKEVLGGDKDLVFTFNNPALKSALQCTGGIMYSPRGTKCFQSVT